MAVRRTTQKRKSGLSVNFAGVESGGGGFNIPDGHYRMKLEEAEAAESKKGEPMIVWDFRGTEGKAKNKKFRYWTSLQPQALFKLKTLLEAMGIEVPDSTMDIDLESIVGDEPVVVGDVQVQEYDGKESSKLVDVMAGDSDDEDDDQPVRKGKKSFAESITAQEVRDMDEDELTDLIDKHGLDIDLTELKTPRKRVAAVIAALEEEGLIG